MKIFEIPGKLVVEWDAEYKAIIDRWSDYLITVDQFREAVLVKGLGHAKMNGGRAWIVDSSKAKNVFSQECQNFIESDIFPAFAKNKIIYFITIASESAITNMGIRSFERKTGPHGLQLVQVKDVNGAKEFLKQH